jgi:hypothetical protein
MGAEARGQQAALNATKRLVRGAVRRLTVTQRGVGGCRSCRVGRGTRHSPALRVVSVGSAGGGAAGETERGVARQAGRG